MWRQLTSNSWYPYVAPFFLFSIFLFLESLHPLAVYAIYPIKTFSVGALILILKPRLPAFDVKRFWMSCVVGVMGFGLWVGLDFLWIKHQDGSGFNPYFFGEGSLSVGLWFFRILGATLVVPVMEELFWRGFLMRYLIQDDFESIALGVFRWSSFLITTAAFASVHGAQWSLGVVVGVLYGVWFVKNKTLGDVMVAHGVTNLLLGIYVLKTERWYFW